MAYNRTDQEKGKSTVLLTGLLFCSCGDRMYPKLSQRKMADGEPIYTYVCKMKERSKRERCNRRNANGNILDVAIIEQIKSLRSHDSSFLAQLEKSRQFYTGNREAYESQLAGLRAEYAENEKTTNGLIDSLGMVGDSITKPRVWKRIGEKRAAIRTVARKVIWDGVNAHVVLLGADEGEIEFPDTADRMGNRIDESSEEASLEAFADVDYKEFEGENTAMNLKSPSHVGSSYDFPQGKFSC